MKAFKLPVIVFVAFVLYFSAGCANIIPPAGGPRDSLPPVLVESTPPDSSANARPARITLTFNEYLEPIQNIENIIISPTLATPPTIDSRLRTVSIRLKDALEENTTYSINFGNTIKDVNEGNVLRDFTYVFSTGPVIHENTLSGRVVLAETGKIDTTLLVILHSNLADTAVIKQRPRYYTRLDGNGNFRFNNLPEGRFAVYALDSKSFLRQYNDSTLLFGFLDSAVVASMDPRPVTIYAYQEAKQRSLTSTTPTTGGGGNRNQDRRLRYSYSEGNSKDVLSPLHLDFSRRLRSFDSTGFVLTDTNYNPLPQLAVRLDSSYTRVRLQHPWKLGTSYKLLIRKDAVADADGVTLAKNDTLSFATQGAEDYGSIRLRFNNLDLSKNPVLQIVQNDVVVDSVALTGREWRRELFKPGEYDLRILFDTNKNLRWDPGVFRLKRQPEIVQSLPRKLTIRSNWENEVDISL